MRPSTIAAASACLALALTACQRRQAEPTADVATPVAELSGSAAEPAKLGLRPEMLIHWDSDGQVACATPELMIEFVGHVQADERTKAMGMLGRGRPCQLIPRTGTAKIVSIRGADPRHGLIEIVAAGSDASDGLWTPGQDAIIGVAP